MTWIGGSRGGKVSSGQNDLSSIPKKLRSNIVHKMEPAWPLWLLTDMFFQHFHISAPSTVVYSRQYRVKIGIDSQKESTNNNYETDSIEFCFFSAVGQKRQKCFFSNKKEERGKNWNCETAAVSYRSSLPRNFWLGQIQQSSLLTVTIGLTCELL